MKEPIVRLSRPTDINNLVALDLKCYPYPLAMSNWQELLNNSGKAAEPWIVVVEVYRKPVGFALWHEAYEEGGDEKLKDAILLLRAGVLPKYRFNGLGRKLIEKCCIEARKAGKKRVRIVIPDIHCRPGDPDDVSQFLNKTGFNTTGEIKPCHKKMYGDWVDGYVFQKEIK